MDWKKIWNRMIYPPLWLMILLIPICTAALVAVFLLNLSEHPVAYVIYVLSFYTLSVVTVFCVKVLPGYYRSIRKKVYDHPLGNRYMTDVVFRTHVSLYGSFAINLLYVAMKVTYGIIYSTAWFMLFAVYYAIMAIMRFVLVRNVQKNGIGSHLIGELRSSLVCAVILLAVNAVLSGAVLMMVYSNRGFEYQGMLIYVMAAYTFYITTVAIVNIVKYRKYNSPILSMTKVISLASALISMLALETAMLSQFGGDTTPEFRRMMIIATGAGISATIVLMSGYVIVRNTLEIRKLKENRE
ncbi:MAG: hypothetical protein IJW92_01645 [Clostridia bacterium]|nr:hypothetical protein [Clostridia bacterium]